MVLIYYLAGPSHSSRHHSNVTYTMESSLTCRTSGLLCEFKEPLINHKSFCTTLHLLLCLIPTLTEDTLRAGVSQPWMLSI